MIFRRLVVTLLAVAGVTITAAAQDLPTITDHKSMALKARAQRNPKKLEVYQELAAEARTGNRDALTALIELAREPETRWFAALNIAEVGPPAASALPTLQSLVQELRGQMPCAMIVSAIGKIGPAAEPAVGLLSDALRDPKICSVAADALALIGRSPSIAVPSLQWAANNADYSCQVKAIEALGSFQESTSVEVLRDILQSREGHMLVHAVEALGRIGPLAAPVEDEIVPLLESDNRMLRSAAELALTMIRGYGSGQNDDSDVRLAIEKVAKEWYSANRERLAFDGVCISKQPVGGRFQLSVMIDQTGDHAFLLALDEQARAQLAQELRPLSNDLRLRGFSTEISSAPCGVVSARAH